MGASSSKSSAVSSQDSFSGVLMPRSEAVLGTWTWSRVMWEVAAWCWPWVMRQEW